MAVLTGSLTLQCTQIAFRVFYDLLKEFMIALLIIHLHITAQQHYYYEQAKGTYHKYLYLFNSILPYIKLMPILE